MNRQKVANLFQKSLAAFSGKIRNFILEASNTSSQSPSSFLEVHLRELNLNHVMANKPLQFVVVERKLNVGKNAGKLVKIAKPTGRHRIDFRNFCECVAKSTIFNRQEVRPS